MKVRVWFSRNTILLLGLSVLMAGCGGGSDSSSNSNTNNNANNTTTPYTISGNVMNDASLGGAGLSGVTVNLTGGAIASTTTDSNGNYSFSVSNGTYTVTPSLSGFSFNPASATVTISDANSTGHVFIASAVAAVSGINGKVTPVYSNMTVCALDITDPAALSLSCAGVDAATGNYSLSNPTSGSFVIYALLDMNNNGSADGGELYGAYSTTQNGTATTVVLNNSGVTGIDITATPVVGSSISGTVTNLSPTASPITVIAVSSDTYVSFGITTADPSTGTYTLSAIPNGTYRIFAWADLNGTGTVDYGEPVGAFTSISLPTLVTVNSADWNSIDFTIQ